MTGRGLTGDDPAMMRRLRRRRAAESRFRLYGRLSILIALAALGWLLLSIMMTGLSAFTQYWVTLDLEVTAPLADEDRNDRRVLADALASRLDAPRDDASRAELLQIISASAATRAIRSQFADNPATMDPRTLSLRIPLSDLSDQFLKGHIDPALPRGERKITDRQIGWIDRLADEGRIAPRFNRALFVNPDSRDPERAGMATGIIGSVMILMIASALALPIGVGAAIYLDSFAPRTGWGGRLTRVVEVNINNLAAVPSIVFGLLGLAVFINVFGLARSIALVGGLVLALRMFPTIVIASRAALQSVPDGVTDAALSLGASKMQAVFGHKVQIAAPGILTGSIIGMAQALGETAPLLMIGMVAFVTEIPASPTDPATALPVQIFLWSGSAETAWAERTSAAVMALLVVLMIINGLAIVMRERLQRRRKL
ncbi:DUF3333 domain-containing protein [Algimonas porphyrae]|uniref:Phosphate transport system permease protein PstA n=1 Tax=Algimonas porphyrae TaxID=1128113 RepID=A0ABQ5V2F8_9PROT|nr:PstA family ABC transporter permease [Algimonas porphyrae]GLQ21267.1 phosphate transport system permease protein PstA [Algimonas porphyrae]